MASKSSLRYPDSNSWKQQLPIVSRSWPSSNMISKASFTTSTSLAM